jgi:hypothetical protein
MATAINRRSALLFGENISYLANATRGSGDDCEFN